MILQKKDIRLTQCSSFTAIALAPFIHALLHLHTRIQHLNPLISHLQAHISQPLRRGRKFIFTVSPSLRTFTQTTRNAFCLYSKDKRAKASHPPILDSSRTHLSKNKFSNFSSTHPTYVTQEQGRGVFTRFGVCNF